MSPATTEQRVTLASDLTSVTVGRHFVRDVLAAWHLATLIEDAELCTSELVANAVRHAGTDLVLSVRAEAAIVVAVEDGEPQLRRAVAPDGHQLADHGRGLHIIAAISHDWGVRSLPTGKVVWFSLRRPAVDGDDGVDADIYKLHRRPGSTKADPAASRHDVPRAHEWVGSAV